MSAHKLLERVARQIKAEPVLGKHAILGDGLCEDIEAFLKSESDSQGWWGEPMPHDNRMDAQNGDFDTTDR